MKDKTVPVIIAVLIILAVAAVLGYYEYQNRHPITPMPGPYIPPK